MFEVYLLYHIYCGHIVEIITIWLKMAQIQPMKIDRHVSVDAPEEDLEYLCFMLKPHWRNGNFKYKVGIIVLFLLGV